MQRINKVNSDNPTPAHKAELCDALLLMLEEGGSRGSPQDALSVVAGVLGNMAQEHEEMARLAKLWASLLEDGGHVAPLHSAYPEQKRA